MKTGQFFVFEGIDGCGKTTQMRYLAQKLEVYGQKCGKPRQTCEPSTGPIGALLRQILSGRCFADPRVVAQLFAADRLDHLTNQVDGVLASLDQGVTVLCDRYYFSSYAYHSEDMPLDMVVQANATAQSLLQATATFYLELSPEKALERIGAGRDKRDIYENLPRLTQTVANYEKAFARFPQETVLRVDGSQAPQAVAEEIWGLILPFLEK